MTAPLLVFGAGGQVGQELMTLVLARGTSAIGLRRADVDICDASAVASAIETVQPRLVVNAAGYTAVDKAESEPARAAAANRDGAEAIALGAAAQGVPVVHLSSDYVFDGTKIGAYVESDPIAPLGVYGRTKAEGETAVREANARHIILRTAWVYGIYGANFLKTMLRLAGERASLRVVADQRGCPTATADVAEAILAVDTMLARGVEISGTYHFAGDGVTTWHDFAEVIVAAQAGVTGKSPPVEAIRTADYPTAARRPANSELDSSLFATTFGTRALDWRVRTKDVVQALLDPSLGIAS